jgi:ubiquinone/menaquinone biosynthesis C-methylase UbiE
LPFLIKKFFDPEQIFFIDIDKKLIKNAKNNINYFRFKKAFFLNADVAAMPFKKNTFDLIVDFSTIDHINNENMKNAFEEIYRTLQKDKYLIIFHLNSEYFNIKRWNAIYKKQNKFPSFYRSIDNLLQIVGKKIKPIEKGYCMPFFSDATLSIHYKFLFNKFYKILPKKFLFSAFNSPKLNLFFYLIGKK